MILHHGSHGPLHSGSTQTVQLVSAPFHEVSKPWAELHKAPQKVSWNPQKPHTLYTEMALYRLPPLPVPLALSGKFLFRLQVPSDSNTLLNTKPNQENLGCIKAIPNTRMLNMAQNYNTSFKRNSMDLIHWPKALLQKLI